MIYAWNTGRMYSDVGQRIAFRVITEGKVEFFDYDRCISGITAHSVMAIHEEDPKSIAGWLLGQYDHFRYTDTSDFSELRDAIIGVLFEGSGLSSLKEIGG